MIVFIMIGWAYGAAYVHRIIISYSSHYSISACHSSSSLLLHALLALVNDSPSHFTSHPIVPYHKISYHHLFVMIPFDSFACFIFILQIIDVIIIV